jgi:predicted DNA-binding protein (MmcQ/YjbR family)
VSLRAVAKRIAVAAGKYPGATLAHPWGEDVYKVNGKVFIFLGAGEDGLGLSVKLPHSSDAALLLPFASPTAYGLGKSGWISARFERGQQAPEGLLLEWLDESYRAIAPKKLLKLLDAPTEAVVARKKIAAKKNLVVVARTKKTPSKRKSLTKRSAK